MLIYDLPECSHSVYFLVDVGHKLKPRDLIFHVLCISQGIDMLGQWYRPAIFSLWEAKAGGLRIKDQAEQFIDIP